MKTVLVGFEMPTPDARYRRADRIAWRDIAGEVLIIHAVRGLMFPLNPAASRIWTLLDGDRDVRAVARELHAAFAVDEDRALQDTIEFLGHLEREGLAVRTGTETDKRDSPPRHQDTKTQKEGER